MKNPDFSPTSPRLLPTCRKWEELGKKVGKQNKAKGDFNEEKAVIIDKYETLCRGIGKDLIEDHVRAIREHEAYEKQQRKQAHRQHEIGAR